MTETNKMLEECANYLLNHCFVLGGVEDQRAKYLYVQDHQKRESLSASADQVLVTVEEVQAELQKMNLPRRLDQPTLEKLLRTLRRYNLARPVGRLSGLDSRIEVFPTVLLALPDSDLADAAAEVTRTRSELSLYERPEDGTAVVEVEE